MLQGDSEEGERAGAGRVKGYIWIPLPHPLAVLLPLPPLSLWLHEGIAAS